MEKASSVEFFSVADLVQAFPGSSRKQWLALLPKLREQGVLSKVGKKFVGRRSAIEAALIGGVQ